jgi:DNA-binding response OmpR family regulator
MAMTTYFPNCYAKRELVEKVHEQHYDSGHDQVLHTLVKRLRKKIEPDPEHPRYIITIRGVGYKFTLLGE